MKSHKLVMLLLVLVLVGISSVSVISVQDAPSLTFWAIGDENSALMYQAAADEWSKTSGVKVVVEPVPWGDNVSLPAFAHDLALKVKPG